jgi:hypothetical protein
LTNDGGGGIIDVGGGKMKTGSDYIAEARAKIGTPSFPLTLNRGHQTKHIEGSHNFDPERGTLTADAEELIRLYTGNGVFLKSRSGVWNQREWFKHTSEIGFWRCNITGKEGATTKGVLHYSKKGVHVVPSDPKGERKND